MGGTRRQARGKDNTKEPKLGLSDVPFGHIRIKEKGNHIKDGKNEKRRQTETREDSPGNSSNLECERKRCRTLNPFPMFDNVRVMTGEATRKAVWRQRRSGSLQQPKGVGQADQSLGFPRCCPRGPPSSNHSFIYEIL